ncbi:TetR family transcriptional regulator [Streptomyces albospinus]|uniref:TetR family transcriptional regulator n=1 Tax=Streptomyces albospinus TaxID=285515 RepID=A0ABQ2VHM4_9ACTN|nr:TetR/AcrR family transcriptional regulator [Streptomyces albospinus]GGU87344.1 TetR family transcriptional regulator [Streptomyces albospinus]
MPKLWNDSIETHRRAVREATIDATAELIAEHGLLSVTMSQIAERAGIGRATLYKYFPDLKSVLDAWHERQITTHLDQLAQARDHASHPDQRLRTVLQTYARITRHPRGHHDSELAALMHRGEHVTRAQQHLHAMIRDLAAEAAQAGEIRDDIAPDELAIYCLHALTAASSLPDEPAVDRLVEITLAGLKPLRRPHP